MSDEMPPIRRATDEEVFNDLFAGGIQVQTPIEAPAGTALRRAIEHWGDPTPQYGPHQWAWRLRCGELPLRVGICPRGAAFALFNLYCQPDEEDEEVILAELSRTLSDED